jgi:hypothetical protein
MHRIGEDAAERLDFIRAFWGPKMPAGCGDAVVQALGHLIEIPLRAAPGEMLHCIDTVDSLALRSPKLKALAEQGRAVLAELTTSQRRSV